ncbi:hypothetical protein D9611_002437 [Ephemerocybe angulata]|uniref:Gfd2/YDR514C-like C-terminal domain-containing protein n=1 Tax=Ephemerocybe angulata TaxID=980116 RepID=A0A8H5C0X5_9AGAR|nr:hypothetical protein D9611_002437 [Tulosesus angulatus]
MATKSSVTLTGYYRYTDIWFDWSSQVPNPEDGVVLKAMLAHDALCHPEHPLHIDGVEGAQLYIGIFEETGEARLLFSSKQVDYIRYWLHAMGMTHSPIPLPYSDCLLTKGELRSVTTANYKDGGALRRAIKDIERNNKRLKGLNPTLEAKRQNFERVRSLWAAKKGAWLAIDFEAWEMDHTVVTEFGWDMVCWKNGEKIENRGHIIVQEARGYTNSKYVPDYRYKYLEGLGKSETVKRVELKARIANLIDDAAKYGPVYLVFHDNNQDLKYLKQLGVELTVTHLIPDTAPEEGRIIVDTSDLIGALLGEDTGNRRGLEKTCRLLQQDTLWLHNAGNDAHYTLSVMVAMASGDHVDKQRDQRWPNQTGPSLTVRVHPRQEEGSDYESDDDDDEDVGPRLGYDVKTGVLWRTDDPQIVVPVG